MAFTRNFVFTDPVAAQQATQYAQIAAQEQAAQDQAFNDRIRIGTQGRISQQNADQQRMMSQSQMMQRADENQKDRISNQTIAGIQAGRVGAGGTFDERIKAQQAADEKARQDDSNQKYETGRGLAMILNNPRVSDMEKNKVREAALKSGLLTVNRMGFYVPLFPPPPAPVVEHINDLRQGVNDPGVYPPPGGMMLPFPRSFRSQTVDFPSAPAGPSPFETPGFQVFRQSDIMNQTVPAIPVDQPWMQPAY